MGVALGLALTLAGCDSPTVSSQTSYLSTTKDPAASTGSNAVSHQGTFLAVTTSFSSSAVTSTSNLYPNLDLLVYPSSAVSSISVTWCTDATAGSALTYYNLYGLYGGSYTFEDGNDYSTYTIGQWVTESFTPSVALNDVVALRLYGTSATNYSNGIIYIKSMTLTYSNGTVTKYGFSGSGDDPGVTLGSDSGSGMTYSKAYVTSVPF